jgi:hypothetical protein
LKRGIKMAELSEVKKHGATRAGQWAAAWVRADRQDRLWMGIGDTEQEALADAKREIDAFLGKYGLVVDEDGYFLEAGSFLEAELIIEG